MILRHAQGVVDTRNALKGKTLAEDHPAVAGTA